MIMMKPISKTAFYTCGVRMLDAASAHPVCGDSFARRLMNEEGERVLETFRTETSPNAAVLARHRVIDDLLRQALLEDDRLNVVLIGAGFDSRAFRLPGGRWAELDEPQVIEYKNARLPAETCANELRRVAIDFSTDSLADKLSPVAGNHPTVIVIEGVLMYLQQSAIEQMIGTLRGAFPQHRLLGDLMNRQFFEDYGRTLHEKLSGLGAAFNFTADDPEAIFLRNGYRRRKKISIIEKAVELGLLEIPAIALETVLTALKDGNAVYEFESEID